MAEYYRIKRHFTIIGHSQNIVELRWGTWNPVSFTVTDDSESGKLFNLIKKLDGSLPSSTIASQENVPKSDVDALIDHLISLGVLEKGAGTALDHYLDSSIPTLSRQSIDPKPILILGDEKLTSPLRSILTKTFPKSEIELVDKDSQAYRLLAKNDTSWLMNGIQFFENINHFKSWENSFVIFAFTNINPVQMRIMNRVALELNIPWIHSAIDGPFLLIGPTFEPKKSSCFECLETRLLMNMRESASYSKYKNALEEAKVVAGDLPVLDAISSLLASHVSLETINYLTTKNNFTLGKMLSIHLPTMEFNYNEVLSVPSCTSCSSIPERDDQELYFDLRAFTEKQ